MDIYQQALFVKGPVHQITKLAEEAAELSAAALHWVGGRPEAPGDLAEEAADVEIMLAQLRLIMGDEIDTAKRAKLTRLRHRIGRGWRIDPARMAVDISAAPNSRPDKPAPCGGDPVDTHIRYVCQCGQSVRIRTMSDGYDAVLEIPCPKCGARMIPEVDDDQR